MWKTAIPLFSTSVCVCVCVRACMRACVRACVCVCVYDTGSAGVCETVIT